MENTHSKSENFFKTACYFEGFLIVIALFLGWLADIDPFEFLHYSEGAIFYGLFGTIPLLLIFLAIEQMAIPAIQQIRSLLLETIAPYLYRYHWTDLFILALIAGVSEEVLFRGVIQPWMENSWGMTAGLITSSILFGLVHAITPLYAFLAMSISIYLGLFLDYGGERNLLTPIVIHTTYDFLAFLTIMKIYRNKLADTIISEQDHSKT
ncbi:MAG: CPBP family intramembrane metalloprotease [Methylococcales symbiont of Hymedesmia sp. n. MRB-2018]|nr:MAG: CPBP family intramembrane metalloprotease [Methylococcales symbiont of Hymedesmia sp. n. MRB-2018]KAF3983763.1 MAG: CPBP family intramembrane metalloprotease [Methylococcales symbiont of Hymedesmia sp. n. MRB-2018]